ncbi:hypothetical protein BFP97_19170 [Roseivirga sp. 4D4]|nr:hypothetical protein BFP97_19170 [Roseivirga sp. 4D4]
MFKILEMGTFHILYLVVVLGVIEILNYSFFQKEKSGNDAYSLTQSVYHVIKKTLTSVLVIAITYLLIFEVFE